MTVNKNAKTIKFENARLIFRNFSGNETQYKPEGIRTFCVVVDDVELAETLDADGWNVKFREPREPGDNGFYYLPVTVNFNYRPPKIVLMNDQSNKGVQLKESSVHMLDSIDIAKVDLIVNPSFWETAKDSGIKAYLKTMYITQRLDELELKYANILDDDDDDLSNAPPEYDDDTEPIYD